MKKVLTARSDNFSGSVRDFARSVMGVSSGLLKRTKHPGRMLVNGQAVFADFRMKPGDVLELVIEQEEDCSPGVEPSPGETDIVYLHAGLRRAGGKARAAAGAPFKGAQG